MKLQTISNLIGGLTVAALVASFAVTQPVRADERPLRIATDGAYPPYASTTAAGKLIGFEIDLINDLCRRMNRKCEFVVVEWNGLIPKLQEGSVDVAMCGLSITQERRKTIAFSLPYYSGPTYCVARKGSALAYGGTERMVHLSALKPGDQQALDQLNRHLKKAVVGVEDATTHELYVHRYFPDVGKIRNYPKQEGQMLDLSIGRVDAVCTGYSNANRFIADQRQQGKEFVMFGPGVRGGVLGTGVAFGLRKDNVQTREALDDALRAAAKEGVTAKLSKQWFGIDGSVRYEESAVAKH